MIGVVHRGRSQQSFAEVWELIVERAEALSLGSGDQLPGVRELAEQLSVKPSIVRDALLQAQARGAVRIVPRVGAFLVVTPAETRQLVNEGEAGTGLASGFLGRQGQNILHVLDARRLIEVELIGRSARLRRMEDLLPARQALQSMLNLPMTADRSEYIELDFRFHAELARPAGNNVLLVLQKTLAESIASHFAALPADLDQRKTSDRFHAAIYAAVAEGNVERAQREMHEHLSTAYDFLMSTLQSPPKNKPARNSKAK